MAYVNPHNVAVNATTRYFTDEDVLSRVPMSYVVIGGVMMCLQLVGCLIIRRKPAPKAAPATEMRQSRE